MEVLNTAYIVPNRPFISALNGRQGIIRYYSNCTIDNQQEHTGEMEAGEFFENTRYMYSYAGRAGPHTLRPRVNNVIRLIWCSSSYMRPRRSLATYQRPQVASDDSAARWLKQEIQGGRGTLGNSWLLHLCLLAILLNNCAGEVSKYGCKSEPFYE
jgi:hypothetical protein